MYFNSRPRERPTVTFALFIIAWHISTHDLVRGRPCLSGYEHLSSRISTHDLVRGRLLPHIHLFHREYISTHDLVRGRRPVRENPRENFDISTHDLVRGRLQTDCVFSQHGGYFNSRPRERPTAIFTQKLILLKSFLKLIAQIISIFHLYKYFLNHFS